MSDCVHMQRQIVFSKNVLAWCQIKVQVIRHSLTKSDTKLILILLLSQGPAWYLIFNHFVYPTVVRDLLKLSAWMSSDKWNNGNPSDSPISLCVGTATWNQLTITGFFCSNFKGQQGVCGRVGLCLCLTCSYSISQN